MCATLATKLVQHHFDFFFFKSGGQHPAIAMATLHQLLNGTSPVTKLQGFTLQTSRPSCEVLGLEMVYNELICLYSVTDATLATQVLLHFQNIETTTLT